LQEFETIISGHKEFCWSWNASVKKKMVQTEISGDVSSGHGGGGNPRINRNNHTALTSGVKNLASSSTINSHASLASGNFTNKDKQF